jgi:hypothetical protein
MKCLDKSIAMFMALFLALGGIHCISGEREPHPGWSKDPANALSPSGQTDLQELPTVEVYRAVRAASEAIDLARPRGIEAMMSAIKADLERKGIKLAALDKINDAYIGTPLIKIFDSSEDDSPPTDGVGQQKMAQTVEDISIYGYCPLEAPEENVNVSCNDMVDMVLQQVLTEIDAKMPDVSDQIAENHLDFSETSKNFVVAWSIEAEKYGAKVAAIYAKNELMVARECDNKAKANDISYKLGEEQGRGLVEKREQQAIQDMEDTCTLNTDFIADQVKRKAEFEIDTFMKLNPICADQDISRENEALLEADEFRRDGIEEGIKQQHQILRSTLREARWDMECDPEEISCQSMRRKTTRATTRVISTRSLLPI